MSVQHNVTICNAFLQLILNVLEKNRLTTNTYTYFIMYFGNIFIILALYTDCNGRAWRMFQIREKSVLPQLLP